MFFSLSVNFIHNLLLLHHYQDYHPIIILTLLLKEVVMGFFISCIMHKIFPIRTSFLLFLLASIQEVYTSEEAYLNKLRMLNEVYVTT